MSRFVSPPKSELAKLRQSLTPGEWRVFEVFDQCLSDDWEIYVQPYLNGLRPDFVLLNPKVGIAVFEVKDWDLDAVRYRVDPSHKGAPKLIGNKNGRDFLKQNDNPIEQVYLYKQEIMNIYCPRLEKNAGFAVVTSGVIFPFADDVRVQTLFSSSLAYRNNPLYAKYFPVVGRDALTNGDITRIFPESRRQYSKFMSDDLVRDMRNWLIEPDAPQTQRQPIQIDARQRALVTSRTVSGYRRIRGAAGSGKSLILAARAAQLLGEGKKVLVITYNITLLHYLMDIAVRWPQGNGNTRKNVTWLNFHYWCKRICLLYGYEEQYKEIWKGDSAEHALNTLLPSLVSSIIDNDIDNTIPLYDAVLVDEGQDLLPNWWAVLRKVCKPGGEMLLVADATQDIYETAKSWTDDAMRGAGFSGNWTELDICYRLPQLLLNKASEFASRYLPRETANLPKNNQVSLDLEFCDLRWVHTNEQCADSVCTDELLRLHTMNSSNLLAIADTTFLCDTKSMGYEVVAKLGQKGIRCVHTYDPDKQESRRQKIGFYMGDARIKATTLHSFKGWESRALVIYVKSNMDVKNLALLYTGITRLKRHVEGSRLTVVSSAIQLMDYGREWPSFEEIYT